MFALPRMGHAMPDVFVSYSSADLQIAQFLQKHLQSEGLDVFLASTSLAPGQRWSQQVLSDLSNANWVLFLASRAACQSPWVQQELGAAVIKNKKLVPIVWDLSPGELPGWVAQFQALDLRHSDADAVRAAFTSIAVRVKADRTQAALIAGLLLAAVLIVSARATHLPGGLKSDEHSVHLIYRGHDAPWTRKQAAVGGDPIALSSRPRRWLPAADRGHPRRRRRWSVRSTLMF